MITNLSLGKLQTKNKDKFKGLQGKINDTQLFRKGVIRNMEDQQINEISGININLSMITVNINGFNFSIKRHKLVD